MEILHIGVITDVPVAGETYSEGLKVHLTDPEKHPFKYEFLRFEKGSPLHKRIQAEPHIAIKVDSIKEELSKATEVLSEEMDCGNGIFIAFADVDGFIFEFTEFRNKV
jgi:hypothetical protein